MFSSDKRASPASPWLKKCLLYLCTSILFAFILSHNLIPANTWIKDWIAEPRGHSAVFDYEEHEDTCLSAALRVTEGGTLSISLTPDRVQNHSLPTAPLLPPPKSA